MFLLQRHVVPKANGGQGDEAVVEGVEEVPPLKVGESKRPHAQCAHAGYEPDGHHVDHGDLRVSQSKALLQPVEQEPDKGVDALTNALEHDQSQRDAQESVEHTEGLPSVCAGGGVAIS